jgi:hypothetical protein
MRENVDDWCEQQDAVPDGDRIYRGSKCGKRLHPRKMFEADGELVGWRLRNEEIQNNKVKTGQPDDGSCKPMV